MKTVLASEAMELCAKAMEALLEDDFLTAWRRADVRAIYQAAAILREPLDESEQSRATGAEPTIPVPDWLAKQTGASIRQDADLRGGGF